MEFGPQRAKAKNVMKIAAAAGSPLWFLPVGAGLIINQGLGVMVRSILRCYEPLMQSRGQDLDLDFMARTVAKKFKNDPLNIGKNVVTYIPYVGLPMQVKYIWDAGNFCIGLTEKSIEAAEVEGDSCNFRALLLAGILNLSADAVIEQLDNGVSLVDIAQDAVGHILDVL